MAIQIRRGLSAARTSITPLEGELLYTTDTKLIYVGDGTTAGGNLVTGSGGGGGGSSYILPAATVNSLGGVIIPLAATSGINNVGGTISLATASTTQLGAVKVDGSTITINASGIISAVGGGGSYTLVPATTTALGGVIIPATATSGITNSNGTIGLATASTTQLGAVKVDGNTVTISAGVISSPQPTASATVLGGVTVAGVATSGLNVSGTGALSLATASATQLGGVTVAAVATSGLNVGGAGQLSLATASATQLGGVKVGTGLSIDGAGVLSSTSSYLLPYATATVIGGVFVPAVATSGLILGATGQLTLATASTTQLGGVKVDGTTITIANGVISGASSYTPQAATTTTLGSVIIPAVATSGITNSSGTIGIATATTTQLGGVKVDGSSVTISGGVISATVNMTRTTKTGTSTASLANNATDSTSNITISKVYLLLKLTVSAPAWVRLYTDAAARTADINVGRSQNSDPSTPGVVAEFITSSNNQTIICAPGIFGWNNEATPNTTIPMAITNLSGAAATITVTATILPLEA